MSSSTDQTQSQPKGKHHLADSDTTDKPAASDSKPATGIAYKPGRHAEWWRR